MTGVLSALLRAFANLADRRVLGILAKSMAITITLFVILAAGAWWALGEWLASLEIPYAGTLGGFAAIMLALLGGWLLFRVVAVAVIQFFADEIVIHVEHCAYPAVAATARPLRWTEDARHALGGAARALAVNLVALPFALLSGPAGPVFIWAVNAWLLGRELTDMVALRHGQETLMAIRGGGGQRFFFGGAIAALMLVPFANLLAPVIGAAGAVHLVHRRNR